MTSVFFASCRHPVMHSPQCRHPWRAGPAPPKYGSGTSSPGFSPALPAPKKTPTSAWPKVWPTPISSATSRITSSDGETRGYVVAPSIRVAWS